MKRISFFAALIMVFSAVAFAGTIKHENQTLTFGKSIYTDYTVRYLYLQADFDDMGLLRLYYSLTPYKSCKTAPDSSIVDCKKIKLVDVQVLTKEGDNYGIIWKASEKRPSIVGFYLDTLAVEADSLKSNRTNLIFQPPLSPFSTNSSKVRWLFDVDGQSKQITWDFKENSLTVSDMEDLEAKAAPEPKPVENLEIGKEMVYSPYSQWIIEASEEETLRVFIDELKANPKAQLQAECHADPYGSDEYNVELSQQRAESVRDYMISKGVSADQLVVRWFGKSRPVAECHSVDECRVNRRCEIMLFLEEAK